MFFNPSSVYEVWHTAWRIHVMNAKQSPAQREGYCIAAAIAQGQYVQWLALEKAKKPNEPSGPEKTG